METKLDKLIKLAQKVAKKGEIPVSCMIVDKNNKILSVAVNNRQKKKNVLGHAEVNAILKAEKKIKDWRLDGYKMIITLKPCEMCQKIIEESRIDCVYYLLNQPKKNNLVQNLVKIDSKIHEKKYEEILCSFFKNKR